MFELTGNKVEMMEVVKLGEELRELADLQLSLVGGGNGAASLD